MLSIASAYPSVLSIAHLCIFYRVSVSHLVLRVGEAWWPPLFILCIACIPYS